jgi:hypothetical protein
MIDGLMTASGDNGEMEGNSVSNSSDGWVNSKPGGGGSGGSIWLYCQRITGLWYW